MAPPLKTTLLALAAIPMTGQAIEIELRYDYDTTGFFNQLGAKRALRACADFFEALITDELAEINAATSGNSQNTWSARPLHPATGGQLDLVDLVIPENTLIIFVGARNISGTTVGFASTGFSFFGFPDFNNTVETRGQAGASSNPTTDYGPWGGSISYDTREPDGTSRVWNFSLTESDSSKTDFVGITLHEFCHLLGVGSSDSWNARTDSNLRFQGSNAIASNGGTAPLVTSDKGHWAIPNGVPSQSPTFGSFTTPHDQAQPLLMNSFTLNDGGFHNVLTDLDLAALIDIGWEIELPANGEIQVANGEVTFNIPTSTGFNYQLLQGGLAAPFNALGSPVSGNGMIQTLTTPLAPSGKDFFRFAVTPNTSPSPAARSFLKAPLTGRQKGEWTWQSKDCCAH